MERQTSNKFGESTLLAYVEQTMSAQQRAEFEAQVAGDPRLLASLRRMQADCEGLRSIPEDRPPASLVSDVLAGIERSMLIESDLIAPPIDMRRYRASHWQRYAAAAGFLLLLSGGGFMLFQTLRFQSSDEILAPSPVVRNDASQPTVVSDESAESTETKLAANDATRQPDEPQAQTPGPATGRPHELASAPLTEALSDPAAFEAALEATADPTVIATLDNEWPADLNLCANVVANDPAAAYESIARRLRARGGDLIINASLNMPGTASGDAGPEPGQFGAMDPAFRMNPNSPASIPVPVNPNPVVTNPDDRVPLIDQSRYAAEGYQFTLLGTPSDILNVLRELGSDRSLRIAWARQGAGRMLVDLVAPNLPTQTRWDHVMFWWLDPAHRFDEARASIAQASTEPFIRIPVRILPASQR